MNLAMAETVKKSRIVSEDTLEESLLEEFNHRLKTCMRPEVCPTANPTTPHPTTNPQDSLYESIDEPRTNGDSGTFLDSERRHHYDVPRELRNGERHHVVLVDAPDEEADHPYEEVPERPSSAKSRMLLSTDDAAGLLFTQTVVSPMLTPSEEGADFLRGFERKQEEEGLYENAEFLNKPQENLYENVEVVKAEECEDSEQIYANVQTIDDICFEGVKPREEEPPRSPTAQFLESAEEDDQSELKTLNVLRQMSRLEAQEISTTNVVSTAQTFESSTYVETTTRETSAAEAEKGSLKKKKSKKARKEEKENISVKSSFSKFDALQKKNVLHVRSSDSSKAQEKFSGSHIEDASCKSCSKAVFQMEQIKAEKAIWHKNCFRCHECNKQLNVDTYESHEGTLYCKPHFRALFAPKVVEDDAPQPSDKPDLGLEELQSLNVKERFQVFEHHDSSEEGQLERTAAVNVKRSPSILSKLARFQAKGMDVGVSDDALNGIPIEESSTSEDEADGAEGEDADLVRAKRVQKEKPFHFTGMSDVKSKWEQGEQGGREERREERKQEIQTIRSRLFLGKQGKMKEMYQQAVLESESGANVRKAVEVENCDTRSIKERFEKGEIANEESREKDQEDLSVIESGISKKSRSIFLEMDANAAKNPTTVFQPTTKTSQDVKKTREAATPEKEVYRDPEVVRAEEYVEDSVVAKESHTATKMLNKFRQMEENLSREPIPAGPKPLKCFTPPPEPPRQESTSGEDESGSEEESEGPEEPQKVPDEDLIEAQKAARAKQLRAKFERWEANEMKREQNSSSVNIAEELGDEQSQVESTRSLRARFESMRQTSEVKQPRVKVHRFVELQSCADVCEGCRQRVYPLEKVSVHGQVYHRSCFKCMECGAILRMDSYSYNQGLLYCLPHFKRLFIAKGNYDTGFGFGQHKEKWNATVA